MLNERHNTHALHSISNSSHHHSYDLDNSAKIKVKKKKVKQIKTPLANRQVKKINDILNKYNLLLDSNKNETNKNIKNKNNDLTNIVAKLEHDSNGINNEEKSSKKLKKRLSIKNNFVKKKSSKDISFDNFQSDNFVNILQNNKEQKNEEYKNYSELREISKLENNKKDLKHALSYKKINKETKFNNINYEENRIKKKLNNDKKQKLLIYYQMNDSKNLIRKINKPDFFFVTKISKNIKYYALNGNSFLFSEINLTVRNKLCFITKTIKGVKKFKKTREREREKEREREREREKHNTTEKKLKTIKNEKIKKEEEGEKISSFSSINTSSSNSIKNTKTKNKTKKRIKSKKNITKQKPKIKSKNFVKKKSLFPKNRLRAISIHSRISNNRLRAISIHSRISNNERSEEKNTITSRKSLAPLIQNMKNKSFKNNNNKFEKQALYTNRENRKFSFISRYHDKYKYLKKNKNEDIISSKSIRNINRFNSPFKNNLLNINKKTEDENNKINNNSTIKGKDKDKINHELDFKKFLEEQKLKRKNQIRNFIKSKGMNSYNFFYPKEPSPLLGTFKNKYSIYPSLNLNHKSSMEFEGKKNLKKLSIDLIKRKLLDKRSKSYLSFKQINKENEERHIKTKHFKEKHYGNEKDCPICRTFKFKNEKNDNEYETSYTRTSKYNKLKSLIKYAGMFSPKSQTSRSSLNDFGIISRNKNPKNRDNIFENESSRIKKNYNVLFDYFLQ